MKLYKKRILTDFNNNFLIKVFMKTNYFLLLFLTTLIFFSCVDTQKKEQYKNNNLYEMQKSELEIIENFEYFGKSQVFYIILNDNNTLFELDLKCKVLNSDSQPNPAVFYVMGKYINTEKFGDLKQPYVFTEVFRNFSEDWNAKNPSVIKSNSNFFTKSISKGMYRIVFTCYMNRDFTALISTKSDYSVQIFNSFEKAKEALSAFPKES